MGSNTLASPDQVEGVQVSISFLKRKEQMTVDQFYHHWENIHGPLVKPWAEKYGFISYKQMHLTPALNLNVEPIGPESKNSGVDLSAYDGCAIIEVPSLEVFAEAFKDPYYISTIEPDERKFLDKKLGVLRARGVVRQIL